MQLKLKANYLVEKQKNDYKVIFYINLPLLPFIPFNPFEPLKLLKIFDSNEDTFLASFL